MIDAYIHRTTSACDVTWRNFFFFEIGSAPAERVGQGKVGGCTLEEALGQVGWLFISCFAQMGLDNHLLAM